MNKYNQRRGKIHIIWVKLLLAGPFDLKLQFLIDIRKGFMKETLKTGKQNLGKGNINVNTASHSVFLIVGCDIVT